MAERDNPDLRAGRRGAASGGAGRPGREERVPARASSSTRVYGIEANEFALHSRIAAQPELGVLPNLGYFVTVNLSVPIWDWGGLRSKLHQSETRERQAQVALTQTQRQLVSNLYSKYNETLTARARGRQPAPHRGSRLRKPAPDSSCGTRPANRRRSKSWTRQNTLVQARNAADDAETRYRVALAELQTLTGPF